jgi:hypothetical protein
VGLQSPSERSPRGCSQEDSCDGEYKSRVGVVDRSGVPRVMLFSAVFGLLLYSTGPVAGVSADPPKPNPRAVTIDRALKTCVEEALGRGDRYLFGLHPGEALVEYYDALQQLKSAGVRSRRHEARARYGMARAYMELEETHDAIDALGEYARVGNDARHKEHALALEWVCGIFNPYPPEPNLQGVIDGDFGPDVRSGDQKRTARQAARLLLAHRRTFRGRTDEARVLLECILREGSRSDHTYLLARAHLKRLEQPARDALPREVTLTSADREVINCVLSARIGSSGGCWLITTEPTDPTLVTGIVQRWMGLHTRWEHRDLLPGLSERNRYPVICRPFPSPVNLEWVESVKVQKRSEDEPYWTAFRRAYPHAVGTLGIFLPAYSADGSSAVVMIQWATGPLNGETSVFRLHRVDGGWKIVQRLGGFYS